MCCPNTMARAHYQSKDHIFLPSVQLVIHLYFKSVHLVHHISRPFPDKISPLLPMYNQYITSPSHITIYLAHKSNHNATSPASVQSEYYLYLPCRVSTLSCPNPVSSPPLRTRSSQNITTSSTHV